MRASWTKSLPDNTKSVRTMLLPMIDVPADGTPVDAHHIPERMNEAATDRKKAAVEGLIRLLDGRIHLK